MVKSPAEVDVTIDEIIDLAEAGDPVARSLVERAGRAIGLAVGSQVNILNLHSVLFGGLAYRGTLLLQSIRKAIDAAVLPNLREQLDVREASLGPRAALVGTASLSLDRMMKGFTSA